MKSKMGKRKKYPQLTQLFSSHQIRHLFLSMVSIIRKKIFLNSDMVMRKMKINQIMCQFGKFRLRPPLNFHPLFSPCSIITLQLFQEKLQ